MLKQTLILDELKKVTRRLENLEKTVDTLGSDRNILEDILLRISELENALHLNRDKQAEVGKSLRNEIKSVEFAVEDKMEKFEKKINNKEVLVVNKGIFAKVKSMVARPKGKGEVK